MDNRFIISNLNVTVDSGNTCVIPGLNLMLEPGKVHALMGPNGSGKSTLAYTLMGHPSYVVQEGSIVLDGKDITHDAPDKRAQLGLFLAFQYPCEIPGVSIFTFLKETYTACTGKLCSVVEFKEMLEHYTHILGIDAHLVQRNVNEGFSGGEKKRLEMLQMLFLNPRIAIIDEIDSGLDVDALKVVARAIGICRERNPAMSVLIITHYQRILQYVHPDIVHIMHAGTIVETGDYALVQRIEEGGYGHYRS